jgi:deoxyribose-phosphate aldolase
MVSNISAQVRSATDIDSILRIAASQIGRSMGVSEVLVQLRSDKL